MIIENKFGMDGIRYLKIIAIKKLNVMYEISMCTLIEITSKKCSLNHHPTT